MIDWQSFESNQSVKSTILSYQFLSELQCTFQQSTIKIPMIILTGFLAFHIGMKLYMSAFLLKISELQINSFCINFLNIPIFFLNLLMKFLDWMNDWKEESLLQQQLTCKLTLTDWPNELTEKRTNEKKVFLITRAISVPLKAVFSLKTAVRSSGVFRENSWC